MHYGGRYGTSHFSNSIVPQRNVIHHLLEKYLGSYGEGGGGGGDGELLPQTDYIDYGELYIYDSYTESWGTILPNQVGSFPPKVKILDRTLIIAIVKINTEEEG